VPSSLSGITEHASDGDLAEAAQRLLDDLYAQELADLRAAFEHRAMQGRATADIADAARAATMGAIDTLLVDMDEVVPGTIDETGRVTFHDTSGADSYDVIDEIACRALLTGARVVSARRPDMPREASLAAILRHPV
jgi:hypothetical protein